ncbi:MAG: hypothetical protein IKW51_10090 [Bacteroidales bacterium]|nr:hypothetical protein [Bacteroidales bacterium]
MKKLSLILVLIGFCLVSCNRKEPVVKTHSVTEITESTAVAGGEVIEDGRADVTERGICWSIVENPTIADAHTNNGAGLGSFVSDITGLTPNTAYYVRAYATNSEGTSYGEQVNFTTIEKKVIELPAVKTSMVTSITTNSAVAGGDITADGGAEVTLKGVCWSTSQEPTIEGEHTENGAGTGEFTAELSGLEQNTTYYVRAYATNSEGTAYGEEVSFTTLQENVVVKPMVTTLEIAGVSQTTAVTGGNVTSDGGAEVTARGVCWSTSQEPTIEGEHTTDGVGTGEYQSDLSGLTANTTYYVRAYATNSEGTAYGEEISFTTLEEHIVVEPTVVTVSVSEVTETTAVTGGNVTSDGGGEVSARGVCWSTSQEPTVEGSHTTDGTGVGEFVSNLTDLTDNTTYFVRAYATNEQGTSYGEQMSFTTVKHIDLPEVATVEPTNIAITSAVTGGNVTSDGGAEVTAKGVCWSTSQNPTISDSFSTDGIGLGEYISIINGLTINTTYYVRAYATNAAGTAYGEEFSFTTLCDLPTVITTAITNVEITTAKGGGNVTADGGAEVTARGLCWATHLEPTIEDSFLVEGAGLGEFTCDITGLNENTRYYVRAYATNSVGTAYGNVTTLKTTDDGTIAGIEYVDLGLSVKWAPFNIGATSPTECGDYFAWGEIETKTEYTEANSLTHGIYMDDIGGNPQYDAARAIWGSTWRLPSREEIEEIVAECTWEWTSVDGMNGCKITGPNGNHIFVPAAGCYIGAELKMLGQNGMYHSYKMCGDYVNFSYGFHFGEGADNYQLDWLYRAYGRSIRPVTE